MDPLRVYDYLALSRAHVFGWLRPLTDGQYRTEHPIGLGSLARTLHHMMGAEWFYMRRVRGETAPLSDPPLEHNPEITTEQALSFARLEPAWTKQAEETRAGLAAVADWTTPTVYTTEHDGEPYAYEASAADIFSQLAIHEVHHRAQAMHMLRRLGVETGEIDYNTLMWKRVDAP